MTTSTASGRNIKSKEYAQPYMPAGTYTPWQRPSDWLTLPSLTSTLAFTGLVAVFNDDNNYITFAGASGMGTYTIDWGDGTSESVTGATVKSHKYNYNDLPSGTLTTRGYRQAIVTVTMTSGSFTGIYLTYAYSVFATPAYNANWLDVSLGGASVQSININSAGAVSINLLEHISIGQTVNGVTLSLSSLLKLFQIDTLPTMKPLSASNLFNGCSSLLAAPMIDTSSLAIFTNTFSGCTSLRYVPPYDMANAINTSFMFFNCRDLESVPQFNTIKVSTWTSMFSGCYSLKSIPYFNTSNATIMTSMFDNCTSLNSAPMMDTSKLFDASFMFNNCYKLVEIPLYNTINVTSTSSMFANCYQLETIPLLNTSNTLNTSGMFLNCYNLKTLPNINVSNSTNATSMFNSCVSIEDLSNININKSTVGPTNTFNGCVNLISLPETINLSNVAATQSIAGIFNNCYELKGNITINTGGTVNLSSAFVSCQSLSNITITGNSLTSITSAFSGAKGARSIIMSNCNSITSGATTAFGTCTNLTTLRMPNLGISCNVASTMLSNSALDTLFTDFKGNATSQTVTITSSAGAAMAPVVSVGSGTWPNNSTSITFAGTPTGVTVGMTCYGTNISGVWRSATVTTGTNNINVAGISIKGQSQITFNTTANGITQYKTYYVIGEPTSTYLDNFTITDTKGSTTPVTITGGGTMNCQWERQVVSIASNIVVLNNSTPAASSGVTVSFRNINIYNAILKNWTITG